MLLKKLLKYKPVFGLIRKLTINVSKLFYQMEHLSLLMHVRLRNFRTLVWLRLRQINLKQQRLQKTAQYLKTQYYGKSLGLKVDTKISPNQLVHQMLMVYIKLFQKHLKLLKTKIQSLKMLLGNSLNLIQKFRPMLLKN